MKIECTVEELKELIKKNKQSASLNVLRFQLN